MDSSPVDSTESNLNEWKSFIVDLILEDDRVKRDFCKDGPSCRYVTIKGQDV